MNIDLAESAERPSRKLDSLEIRALRLEDAEMVTAIANMPGYRAGTLGLPYQSIEETRRDMEKPAPGSLRAGAVVDEQIIGYAGLRRYSGRQIHTARLGIGVHDDFVGRGVGSALLGALADAADNWLAIKRLDLTVFVDNAPAIRLYEKFGFEVEGRLRAFAFRNGVYVDAFTMARIRL